MKGCVVKVVWLRVFRGSLGVQGLSFLNLLELEFGCVGVQGSFLCCAVAPLPELGEKSLSSLAMGRIASLMVVLCLHAPITYHIYTSYEHPPTLTSNHELFVLGFRVYTVYSLEITDTSGSTVLRCATSCPASPETPKPFN